MESATDAVDATECLKREYLRLRHDIRENDKCIEAARRKNDSQLRTLNQLLHKRSTLAHQVCQFAQQFTDAYADHDDSLAEMKSLRHLCQANRDHIRGLTTAIAGLQDDQSASSCSPAEGATEPDAVNVCGPAAGDERSASKHGTVGIADPQLRPKGEFFEMLGRCAAAGKNEDDDGKSRRAGRLKHPEGDMAAPRHLKHAAEPSKKTKVAAFGTLPAKGRLDRLPTAHHRQQSPTISPLVYALILVAALSSVPFLCPDTVWHRMIEKYLRTPPSQPPLPPVSPMSVLQRARKFCGL